jgi:hypothetical protein
MSSRSQVAGRDRKMSVKIGWVKSVAIRRSSETLWAGPVLAGAVQAGNIAEMVSQMGKRVRMAIIYLGRRHVSVFLDLSGTNGNLVERCKIAVWVDG